ncbi:hypothetical protein FB567DRAFT_589720 [Paraphoma chrysanthemicola]|uniref:Ethanolamine utilization protein n=1 Tax=Paraphoma chrysanthemicola TaxID=798071 RepID=A0A8K0RAT8_9PLEO|nr:hypothetical protein FB567DRAFT_589720 [Paraphoma chrysanthemicola]
MPAMQYFEKAQSSFKPPLVANENAYLGDVGSTESTSPGTPISGGFYRLEKGTPLDYTYTFVPLATTLLSLLQTNIKATYSYDEMKIILEGHFYIKDETGKEVKAEKGDVFLFPKGSRIIFRTDDYGLAFFVGQREQGKI